MNIMELGAIGELVGGVAVIGSLIYVGLQVRQNTRAVRADNRESMSGRTIDILMKVAGDADTARIFRAGMNDPATLDGDSTLRLQCMMYSIAESWEAAFSQWERGLLTDHDWEKWNTIIGTYKACPGSAHWWPPIERMMSREFLGYWENLPEQDDVAEQYWAPIRSKSTTGEA